MFPRDLVATRAASSESLNCGSQNSIGVGVDNHAIPFKSRDFSGSNEQVEETEEKPRLVLLETSGVYPGNPALASDERLDTCAFEGTQERDAVAESKENWDSFIPCQQNHPSRHDVETTENSEPLSDDGVQLSGEGLGGRKQQAHKPLIWLIRWCANAV